MFCESAAKVKVPVSVVDDRDNFKSQRGGEKQKCDLTFEKVWPSEPKLQLSKRKESTAWEINLNELRSPTYSKV
jgi:hypothetical protein